MAQRQGSTRQTTDTGEPALFVTSGGLYGPVTLDSNGNLPAALAAGSAVIGKVGIDQTTPGTTNATSPAGLQVSGTGSALNDTPIAATDVGAYRWVALQITGTFSAIYSPECSNDGTNYVPLSLEITNAPTSTASTGSTSGIIWTGPIATKYFRVRISSYASGAVTATAWFSSVPSGLTTIVADTELPAAAALADGATNPTSPAVGSHGKLQNGAGTTWDNARNNHEVTVLASAARTTSTNSSDLTNYNARGVQVVVDITAVAGSPSLTFTIKGKCTLSGKYVTLLTSAALTGTGTTLLTVYPGATAAANLTASMPVPRVWRVEVTAGTADSVTYSVSANYIN